MSNGNSNSGSNGDNALSTAEKLIERALGDLSIESAVRLELMDRHFKAARGLDAAWCPLGVALREYDPASVWCVGLDVVCRYKPAVSGFVVAGKSDAPITPVTPPTILEDAYDMEDALKAILAKWDTWYRGKILSKMKGVAVLPFPTLMELTGMETFEVELLRTEYPEEHIQPGYYAAVKR